MGLVELLVVVLDVVCVHVKDVGLREIIWPDVYVWEI